MAVMGNPDRFFPRGDDRFRVEVLDDDVLLLDVQTNIVHRVPGAEVDRLLSGSVTYQTGHLPPGGARAIRRAVDQGSVARRSLLVGGGALVASGIMSSGLPFAAAAASLYPAPFDGTTYTDGWNGQTDGSGWSVSGPWSGDSAFYANPGGITSFQVVLHATSGGKDTTDESGSGHGAYIVATIDGLANTDNLNFYIRAGGEGGGAGTIRGGAGGIAVGVAVSEGASTDHWLLVAGAGGGDSGGAPGGHHSRDGGGERPGTAPSGSTGGTGGVNQVDEGAGVAERGTNGYDALATDTTTLVLPGSTGGPPTRPGEGGVESSGRLGGGGGGAGWAGGGGGGGSASGGTVANAGVTDGGGGGGGSSLIRTSALGGPQPGFISSYSIYTVARPRLVNGAANVRFEAWS